MNALKLTYIVVLQNPENEKVIFVYTGTFNQVVKKAKFACPVGWFIREIKVA